MIEVRAMRVTDLIPYVNNARQHSDEQVAQIAASIREFGFNNPILCDGQKGVIAGHGRLLAARKLGLEMVPAIELAHLTETQKKAYILADNRIAENATWDEALVRVELEALRAEGFDTLLTGFDLQEESDTPLDRDEGPPLESVAVSLEGDVWLLGQHRLTCGDATVITDIDRAMGGVMADACWTDPPL
ncbi:ParB/Srx family N-terminal domain-containing protein [Desulfuromonas thiophila]|uniref:ParB-like nuclease domain-containing protein n=1 Tax=Desulfuromonas thiophila TaxID=57664 RepID=A0A1G7B212_9BACT|nr:ParB/Srx family N-terminal domain-containing protein [Desulfuromonas thiophila]SDE21164.1 ParB-like nuclease domain-containing protein [Desulfuromonas thiophila]